MIATRKPGLLCLAGLALSLSASAVASPVSDAPAAVAIPPAIATPEVAPLAPVWTFPAEGSLAPVASSPTVYRDTVYVGTDDGKLFALRATGPDGGKVLPGFPLQLDGAVKGRPALYGARDGERVYVATTNGSLYAFRLDGTPAWQRNPQTVSPGAPILSTPAVRGEYVYVTTSDGRILRRHVSDGRAAGGFTYGRTIQTRLPREQRVTGTRTHIEVEDASGLFPAGRIRVVSNNPLGETVVTTYTYSGVNTAMRPNRLLNLSPVGDGDPLALNPKNSVILGEGPGVSCNVSPAVPGRDEATFVITALDGAAPASRYAPADPNLVALKSEPYGLLPQWEETYGLHITTAPLVDEQTGRLYIGSRDADDSVSGRLYALQASNGQPDTRWPDGGSLSLMGALEAGPWLDHATNRLYFGTTDGHLYAVNAADGAPAVPPTRLPGAGSFHATPVMVGSRLYLGSHSGRFYSVPVDDPSAARVYTSPDGAALDTSPSASGSAPARDVIVVASASGKILAFPVE